MKIKLLGIENEVNRQTEMFVKCLFCPNNQFFLQISPVFCRFNERFCLFRGFQENPGTRKGIRAKPNHLQTERSWNFQQLIGAVWYYLIFCHCRSNDSYFQESWSIFSRANVLRSCYSSLGSFQNEMIYSWVLPVVQRTEVHYGKKLRMRTGLLWSLLNIRGVPMDVDFIFCTHVLMMMIISIILYLNLSPVLRQNDDRLHLVAVCWDLWDLCHR